MRRLLARCTAALAVVMSMVPAVSSAEESAVRFPVSGSYGNVEGCKAIAQQETSSDDLLFLTPEAVGTYAAYCTPLAIWPAGEGTFVAPVTCGHEGDDATTVEHVRVVRASDGRDAYSIFPEQGTPWGEASRCK